MFRRACQNNQNGNVNFMLYRASIKNFQVSEIFKHFTNWFLEIGFLGKKCVYSDKENICPVSTS